MRHLIILLATLVTIMGTAELLHAAPWEGKKTLVYRPPAEPPAAHARVPGRVEVPADRGGPECKRLVGGYHEHMFSCNPIWEPKLETLPDHSITRGVKPFQARDEWYFNMRFADGLGAGNEPADRYGTKFWPILVAKPGDSVRKGPYVYPKGPYDHIVAAGGRMEAMMWAIERPDGGRNFGFTGGHFHDNGATTTSARLS